MYYKNKNRLCKYTLISGKRIGNNLGFIWQTLPCAMCTNCWNYWKRRHPCAHNEMPILHQGKEYQWDREPQIHKRSSEVLGEEIYAFHLARCCVIVNRGTRAWKQGQAGVGDNVKRMMKAELADRGATSLLQRTEKTRDRGWNGQKEGRHTVTDTVSTNQGLRTGSCKKVSPKFSDKSSIWQFGCTLAAKVSGQE